MGDAPALAVVMDYQNVHLTARDLFAPYGTPVHEVLVHPLRFAEQLLEERALRQGDERQRAARLTDVFVYRGQPGTGSSPTSTGSRWRRSPSGSGTAACT